jgi:ABC-type branched-subunit amino acid transport system ATPase component
MKARAHSGIGGVKSPAALERAKVMVVFGKTTCLRSAQLEAAAGLVTTVIEANAASASSALTLVSRRGAITPEPFKDR